MTIRQFALGLLILFATTTIACSDAFDDAEAKAECTNLVSRGKYCIEWFWTEYVGGNKYVERGPSCDPAKERGRPPGGIWTDYPCDCNRKAYQCFPSEEVGLFSGLG